MHTKHRVLPQITLKTRLTGVVFAAAILLGYHAWQTSRAPVVWHTISDMNATLVALRKEPNKTAVYRQVQAIATQLPSMQTHARKNSEYDADLAYVLSTWQSTFESLAMFHPTLPQQCTAWYEALQFTWGEHPTQWDVETQNLWDFVSSFCQVDDADGH